MVAFAAMEAPAVSLLPLMLLGVPLAALSTEPAGIAARIRARLASFEGHSSMRTWLFGIAMRVASDWARRIRRHPSEPLCETLQDARENAPFERAARSEALSTLHRLLDELSPDQRAVFVLVELEQMSVGEAANAVSANIHTVTSRLKVARQKFEAALRRHRAADSRSLP